jgi:hypothetical protein
MTFSGKIRMYYKVRGFLAWLVLYLFMVESSYALTLYVGQTSHLVTPTLGVVVTYSSDDVAVATVDSGGVITAVAVGSATVTAADANGSTEMTHITITQTDREVIYSATNSTLHLPAVDVPGVFGNVCYQLDFVLLSTTSPITLQLDRFSVTPTCSQASDPSFFRHSTYVNGILEIPALEVAGVVYQAEMTMVDADTLTFEMTSVALSRATTALNDTGISWGGSYPEGGNESCSGEVIAAQDCSNGRDAEALAGTLTKRGGGHGGFDFTKLDQNGAALDPSAAEWSCVRDHVTGLIWEVKSEEEGLHHKYDRYNWYSTDATNDGGYAGLEDDDGDVCYGYSSSDAQSYCNTEAYIARVNREGLCGYSDWRLPSQERLGSILDRGQFYPAIDSDYFSHTLSTAYWSSTPSAGSPAQVRLVDFSFAQNYMGYKSNDRPARLVRGGE